ncbi:unnamed protein product, partial [Ceratitis capitata]
QPYQLNSTQGNIEIKPRCLSNYAYKVESPILLKPDKTFKWEIDQWQNYILGEPTFNKSDRIDVVIGSDVRADIRVLQ